MSFGDLFDGGGGSAAGVQYPYGVFASSPALSLAAVRTSTYAPARRVQWLRGAGRVSSPAVE